MRVGVVSMLEISLDCLDEQFVVKCFHVLEVLLKFVVKCFHVLEVLLYVVVTVL